MPEWNLYIVEHPIGTFIGVAKSMEKAKEHWGTVAKITLATETDIIDLRAASGYGRNGKQISDRVFLAI